MNKKFDINKIDEYKNKWCLYRKYDFTDFHSIFVIDIKESVIKCYDQNIKKILYFDMDYFDNYEFFISPFKDDKPNC